MQHKYNATPMGSLLSALRNFFFFFLAEMKILLPIAQISYYSAHE